jgi:hypothetical protein
MRAANVNNAIRSCFTILSIGALRISGLRPIPPYKPQQLRNRNPPRLIFAEQFDR